VICLVELTSEIIFVKLRLNRVKQIETNIRIRIITRKQKVVAVVPIAIAIANQPIRIGAQKRILCFIVKFRS
jgi:hypothetical protein